MRAAFAAAGRTPPAGDPRLQAPTLDPLGAPYWDRWHVLHRGRQYSGMSGTPCGLSVPEIEAWATRARLVPREAVFLLQQMDAELLAHALADTPPSPPATPV